MNTRRDRNVPFLLAPLAAVIVFAAPSAGAAVMGPAAALPKPPAATNTATSAATPPTTATTAVAPPVTAEAGSYDVGLMLGSQLEHNGLLPILSLDALIRGLKDAVGGHAMTAQERDAAIRFMRDAHSALAENNRAAGKQFLERNAKLPGVVTMPSGLQYRVLAEGDPRGKPPAPTDQVTVRYRASLADGTEFDRSDTHDRPATFRVNSVFKGWQEAFLGMKPGAKWQLFVPPELGYGTNSPPSVPPGAVLVYELELLHVDPAEPVDLAAAKHHPAAGAKPASPPNPQH
jgi:FKBP-type peptidyl-prolyl cis-trans isomerase FklB